MFLTLKDSLTVSVCVTRFLPSSRGESSGRDERGCCPAAGPPAQPAEHHQCGNPQTRPPHLHLPPQGAADPTVCHCLSVHHPGKQGPGNQHQQPDPAFCIILYKLLRQINCDWLLKME